MLPENRFVFMEKVNILLDEFAQLIFISWGSVIPFLSHA